MAYLWKYQFKFAFNIENKYFFYFFSKMLLKIKSNKYKHEINGIYEWYI